MQSCEFSETQFSFCFTFEYIKQFFPIIPLPIFPNTVNEGRVGGGYDVKIRGNIFFQFKIPNFYDKVSNFWRRDWDVFGHEYYKIKIETDMFQFKLLKDLELPGNEVYYSTPEFHKLDNLSNYYSTDNIVSNSAIFSIRDLPNYGSGYHNLIYSPKHNWGKLFSEPQDIKKIITLNPNEIFKAQKLDISIYKQALLLSDIIRKQENNSNIKFNYDNKIELVKNVYSILLAKYNVHWYPVIG